MKLTQELLMNKFKTLVLVCAVALNLVLPGRADATVGLIFKSPMAKTIGGIGAKSGVVLSGASYLVYITANNLGVVIASALGVAAGLGVGALGLIILDDKTVADMEFMALPIINGARDAEKIEIYNSELSELNAVRKTIQFEIQNSEDQELPRRLWEEYRLNLSPETVEVAEEQAANFMRELSQAL
jgi:hypothetical protein